jgi:TIR domain-containing protein
VSPTVTDSGWEQLQATFALASPILAIGPGCHRIGHSQTDEWERVVDRICLVWHRIALTGDNDEIGARRDFLARLWSTKQADDASPPGDDDDDHDAAPAFEVPPEAKIWEREPALAKERARVALATDLLCVLVEATRALGAVVQTGAVPVSDWQLLSDKHEPAARAGVESRKRVEELLCSACALANDLALVRKPSSKGPFPALERHGLKAADGRSDKLQLLKIQEIHAALRSLLKTRFGATPRGLSGAVVEWLSDLFWHVVASGAGVPPSQEELNFYVNLQTKIAETERRFSRPHPGEYRGPADGGQRLSRDLVMLLGDYDSGQDERTRDWSGPREAFARTMAATLLATWRAGGGRESRRPVIALVSDYDLMLERALVDMLGEDEGYHVLVPAVTDPGKNAGKPQFEWLYGTHEPAATPAGREIANPLWRWFSLVPKIDVERPRGPIVIRLTGCPLYPLGTLVALGLTEQSPAGVEELAPAAVFSEHDSVRSIVALVPSRPSPGQPPPDGLWQSLFGADGLTWEGRGWLFFGHRFSDWLPRLQLLITALMLGQGPSIKQGEWRKPGLVPSQIRRIAVSRHFDWPEQALLDALTIEMHAIDLIEVSGYFAVPSSHHESSLPNSKDVVGFLQHVGDTVGVVQRGDDSNGDAAGATAAEAGGSRTPPKVFVSYSHEDEPINSEWNSLVATFAEYLEQHGIDVDFDQYDSHLGRDWSIWGPQAVQRAEIVVCIASPGYAHGWDMSAGSGVADEATMIRNLRTEKPILFVVFPGRSSKDIPVAMKNLHFAQVGSIDDAGMNEVLRLLTDQPRKRRIRGPIPLLPPE